MTSRRSTKPQCLIMLSSALVICGCGHDFAPSDGAAAGGEAPSTVAGGTEEAPMSGRSPNESLGPEPSREVDAVGDESPNVTCEATGNAFDVIQARIFDRHRCSVSACHGSSAVAGLNLAAGHAYAAIVGVAARFSDHPLVTPGAPDESFLYRKLRAATEPGSLSISGSPMPSGLPPLTPDDLSAMRAWILAGAPKTGPVPAPGGLSDAAETYVADVLCRSDTAAPSPTVDLGRDLSAPAADEGIQFPMPTQLIPGGSEEEVCFATYYDVSETVPQDFRSEDGEYFFVDSTTIRLSPGSHHLSTTNVVALSKADLADASFGAWTCNGGDQSGRPCDAADLTSCGGAGTCVSTPAPSVGCLGYGPPHSNVNPAGFGLGTALSASETVPRLSGVFREVPIRGVLFWDFHGFNLAEEDKTADGRINLTYAKERRELESRLTVNGALDGPHSVPPFRRQRLCNLWEVPQGSKVLRLTSHTHHRGSNFRVWAPNGDLIYESLDYETPAYVAYEPALTFLDDDPAARTLKFCADFNNGINPDGTPNLHYLTQVSLFPDFEVFKPAPVACSTGTWGTACLRLLGDAQCDSSPAAGDGKCDAAGIGFGQTSASEMFIMAVDAVMPDDFQATGTLFDSTFWASPLPNMSLD